MVKDVGNKTRKQRNDLVEKATIENFSGQLTYYIIMIFILNDFKFSHMFSLCLMKIFLKAVLNGDPLH